MKILFYRCGSSCEPGVLEAFAYLGHEVAEVTEEIHKKNVTSVERMELLNKILQHTLYDMIFTINYDPMISKVCCRYQIYYCSFVVDAPAFELYSDTVANDCNRIFVFDRGLVQDIDMLQNKHVYILPLCADVKQIESVWQQASDAMKKNYQGDVAFVGSLYSEKCVYNRLKPMPEEIRGYLEGIIEAQLQVYGYNFLKELITPEIEAYFLREQQEIYHFPERTQQDYKAVIAHEIVGMKVAEQERIRLLALLSQHFAVNLFTDSDTTVLPRVNARGVVKRDTEMPIVFHESKININITAKPIPSGLPHRIFDVLAAQGFLITNYQAQLSEVFEIGKDLECYSSKEELLEKVAFYLQHDVLRQEIARHGYEKVKQNHTYRVRIKQMLDIVEKTL